MPIRALPALLVNQIAAGEVIERPASVVKELVENAIDAGALRVRITIEAGGTELIEVADDGAGMAPDELPLAIAPHATSKIESANDLEAIGTLGFRGEALASIASVSRMMIISRPRECESAARIRVEGSNESTVEPVAGPVGTTITVRNLFYNTPARRKFMRTPPTEAGHVREIASALALAHPEIAVSLSHDGRVVFDLPAKQTPKQRALAILGSELEPELLELESQRDGARVWGMIGRPGIARATSRHIMMFVNGRRINDRTIHHALKEAYRGLIEPNRHPTAVLFIVVDPAAVDVNVHPTKAEVRFRHQAQVHGLIRSAVRERLREADLAPGVQFAAGGEIRLPASPWQPPREFGRGRDDAGSETAANERQSAQSFVDYFRRLDPKQKGFVYTEVKSALEQEPEIAPLVREQSGSNGAYARREDDAGALPMVQQAARVLQVHSSFIVTQDEQGLVIIDQHALHERVMFEKLKARVSDGALQSQQLLMPAVVRADRAQVEALENLQPMLGKLGIDAQPMGPESVAVHAFTTLLFERKVDPVEFMSDLLDRAGDERFADDPEAALHEVLDMMACKAAIKAGDRLSDEELAELVQYRERVERSSNCPHGRPTSLRLSIRDLEKQFGRT